MFLSKNTPVLALDIGTHSVKVTKLKKNRSGYQLENFGIMPLPPETIVDNMVQDPDTVINAIKNLIKAEKIKIKDVVTGISGESVVIKKISLPAMTEEELAESIRIEAEQYIPFDIDDVHIDYQILKGEVEKKKKEPEESDPEEAQIEVLLVAAKKDIIEERVSIINQAGLNPVVVDIDVFAMENSFELNYKETFSEGVIALVDVGAGITNINILEDGITAFTKDIPIGGTYFTQTIMDELNISYEIAENLKFGIETEGFLAKDIIPLLISGTEMISQEINKAFEFYSTAANRDIEKIFLSGGCASIMGMEELLEKNFNTSVELNDPLREVKINNKIFDPEYIDQMKHFLGIGVGLAIRRFFDR